MPKLKIEFDLSPEQMLLLNRIMAKEKVMANEACRLLLIHHLDLFLIVQKALPREAKRSAPFLQSSPIRPE